LGRRPPQRFTVDEFNSTAEALDLAERAHDVIAAFGLWRFGVDAWAGEAVPPTS
jgi:hypothetical protein